MVNVETNGSKETYTITFDSDDIRTVLSYHDCDDLPLNEIRDIADAISDMFDDYFAEWVMA